MKQKVLSFKSVRTLLIPLFILMLVVAGCSKDTSSNKNGSGSKNQSNQGAGEAVKGGSIKIDQRVDYAHLDPAMAYDFGSWEVVLQFYDQLLTYKPDSSELTTELADSYDVSEDGLTYTFKLKQGVKFWNGKEMKAQSFIDQFERILTPAVGSPARGFIDPLVVGSTDFFEGKADKISGLEAPDDYTLVIKLTEPRGNFLYVMGMPFFSPIDKEYVDSIGDKEFDRKPLGTGPWKMESYDVGKQMVLKKNENYFKEGEPKLDEIVISIESNEQNSVLKFKQGETAFIGWNQEINSADFVQLQSDPNFKDMLMKKELASTYYLALNNQVKPMDNVKVRQAINMAIDKEKIVKLQNGRASVANQILPPTMPGYQKNLPAEVDYKFDKEKAKKLLAEAGHPDGFKVEMLSTSGETDQKIVQSIQADLKDIGIDVEIRPLSGASYSDGARSLKYGLVYTAWFQDFPDPTNFLDVLLNGAEVPANNWAAYNNSSVNEKLNKAKSMAFGQERIDLYVEIQNEILAEAPWVPLFNPVRYAIVQPWLKGYYQHPVLMDPLHDISMTKK
ncbi:ABC transporter substrate-binding protein [Neobacillus niacini]|uniref:ABC transporter substrate-binding protein n=1 Tax=Neobacillus niacini TaxID=86668 RepID=UPI0021CB5CA8|nr:ABC transporter substrate-binding protein [Neobacillus niacini]MCM3764657.1 ABC transporter substrate-binding protein [Neobacillus niacini]